MEKEYSKCQSCGMPMKKSPNGGGTHSDQSISTKYCYHCLVDGEFTQPEMTAGQMQEFVKAKMKTMGFPGFLTGLFTKGIPKLARWQKK